MRTFPVFPRFPGNGTGNFYRRSTVSLLHSIQMLLTIAVYCFILLSESFQFYNAGELMKLKIGEKIKELRYKKGLTQEEIGAILGVSAQSVSKWERGEGYPDIEMLPSLANYFGISIDELLGADADSKKYDEINTQWAENNKNGLHNENIALMKQALKTFPNDALLLVQLSTSLEKAGTTDEEKSENLRESIAVQEQIIKYCDDCEVRGATMYNICFAYLKNGEHEKALEQANKLPNLYKGRENALVCILDGEEKRNTALSALAPLAWSVSLHLNVLAETTADETYTLKAKEILEILYDCNNDSFIENLLTRYS